MWPIDLPFSERVSLYCSITAASFKKETLLWFSEMVSCNCCLYWLSSQYWVSVWTHCKPLQLRDLLYWEEKKKAVFAKGLLWQRLVPQTLVQWWSTQRRGGRCCVLWATRHRYCPCCYNCIYSVFHVAYSCLKLWCSCAYSRDGGWHSAFPDSFSSHHWPGWSAKLLRCLFRCVKDPVWHHHIHLCVN